MPWVPVHESGLSYTFYPADPGEGMEPAASMEGSTVFLDRGFVPSSWTNDGNEVHWFIEFGAEQGNVQFRITVQQSPLPEGIGTDAALFSINAFETTLMSHSAAGVYEGEAVPYNEGLKPFIGFYAGVGEKGSPSQYLVEVWVGGPEVTGLSLIKDSTRVQVSPYVPAQPAVAPLAFHMYATPLPVGWRYEPYYSGSVQYPRDLASFNTWSTQIMAAPPEYGPGDVSWVYVPVENLAQSGYSIGLPAGTVPVYGYDGNGDYVLLGYRIPEVIGDPTPLPRRYWGPLPYMTFVTFPDVETDGPYGYPVGPGPFEGYFDVPTVTGVQRFRSIYHKDHRGVLLRETTPALPPYCTQRGPARVVAIANFPGCPAVPAQPAVFAYDRHPGWNAGASSEQVHAGDCLLTFTPVVESAVAVGISRYPRTEATSRENLTHAFYVVRQGDGTVAYAVMESGKRVTAYQSMDPGDVFAIRRDGGVVSYLVNDNPIHVSVVGSEGPVCVGAALHLGGDGVY